MTLFGSLHLTRFFFLLMGIGVLCIGASYFIPFFSLIGKTELLVVLFTTVVDVLLIYSNSAPVLINREFQSRMNLGDENKVNVTITNVSSQVIQAALYEGYPVEMQKRSTFWSALILPKKSISYEYHFIPKKRGEVVFRNPIVFLRSPLFLAQRRLEIDLTQTCHVYPSVMQMKQMELKVFNQQTQSQGIKKVRRIGNTSEFEQIKNYVQGDDVRTINWKATSRKNELMVNQYQEERSQPVYCIVDKSRPMQMAFNGLSMLDYAINSTLVFSNIALRKGDRAGLITFSDKIGSTLTAEKSQGHLRKIMESLYNQKTHFKEGNFELLYQTIRQRIKTRSLLLLFTNFESEFAMRRALPMLQRLNQRHVLVVCFFQNNELESLAQQPVSNMGDLIQATVAEKLTSVKWNIARELRQHGIQTVLSPPEELSINSINKYLEIKAKGVI